MTTAPQLKPTSSRSEYRLKQLFAGLKIIQCEFDRVSEPLREGRPALRQSLIHRRTTVDKQVPDLDAVENQFPLSIRLE